MSATPESKPSYTTHALLLGFKHSHLKDQIVRLGDVMRNALHWNTTLYWIDGTESGTAQDRLDNIAYTLASNIQHPNEQIIVYYGGYASTSDELPLKWSSRCGMTWHASPISGTLACDSCSLFVDPSELLLQLLKKPNDLLVFIDSRPDLREALATWMHRGVFQLESRQRNVHIAAIGDSTKVAFADSLAKEACEKCGNFSRLCFAAQDTSDTGNGTEAFAQNLADMAARWRGRESSTASEATADGSVSSVQEMDTKFILGSATLKLPPPGPSAKPAATKRPPPYKAVNALLMHWDMDHPEDLFAISNMKDTLKEYFNYNVETLRIPDDADTIDGWPGHDGLVGNTLHSFVDHHGQAGNLVIVYYVGHGAVRPMPDRLRAARSSDGGVSGHTPRFDLSRIQAVLRDCCPADVLLILDCCNAAFVPTYADLTHRSYVARPNHIMETLAACTSQSKAAGSGPHTFGRRLVGQLILNGNQRGGITVDQLNTVLMHDGRYREAFPGREDESMENIRILNCGMGSILLERYPRNDEEVADLRSMAPMQDPTTSAWSR